MPTTHHLPPQKESSSRFDLVSRVLFPVPEASYGIDDFPNELIWVPKSLNPQTSTPEDCIPCLFLISPSARFLILYLHSNAEDLGRCYPFCSLLRYQFQVHVLAVEYPGYGICPGRQADEESVTENAFVAFRFIREVLCWPLDGILILGRSVGTGPALAIAIENEVYGVILISPFLSIQEIVRDVIGPLAYFITDRFPNKERVSKLRSPLLLVHGKKDIVVPPTHGEKLYQLCKTRKRLVCPETMEHNTNLHADAGFFVLPMLQFFALPDYCFDEIRVPHWAYDKRLSIHYNGAESLVTMRSAVCCSDGQTLGAIQSGGTDGKKGGFFEAAMSKEVTPKPSQLPQLVMSPYNTPAPGSRPTPSACGTPRQVFHPSKPAPSVVPQTPSLQEVMRIRLQQEGRASEAAAECFGDFNDYVAQKAVEEAATAAVHRFLRNNGIDSLQTKVGPKEHCSSLLGPDILSEPSPDDFAEFDKELDSVPGPQQETRDTTEADEGEAASELPEPASDIGYVKVPCTRSAGPTLMCRDGPTISGREQVQLAQVQQPDPHRSDGPLSEPLAEPA